MESNSTIDNSSSLLSLKNISVSYIDFGVRVLGLVIYVVYFLAVFRIAEFRKATFFYLHQVNLIGLLYCLMYTFFINNRNPKFASAWLNNFLCTWCELAWSVLKFMRILSILQLTIYRYLAMFKLTAFKRLNQSKLKLFALFAVSWTLSILTTVVLKFSLQTNYSIWFCIDGSSSDLVRSIIYYVCVVGITIFIVICNIALGYKMKNHLSGQSRSRKMGELKATRTNFKFIRNLFVLNCLMLSASISSLAIDFQVIILEQKQYWYLDNASEIVRPILRIIFILILSFIPITSLFIDHKKRINLHLKLVYSFLLKPTSSKVNPSREDKLKRTN
jgi:hypothetical protein